MRASVAGAARPAQARGEDVQALEDPPIVIAELVLYAGVAALDSRCDIIAGSGDQAGPSKNAPLPLRLR
jgi:hypothetical protein